MQAQQLNVALSFFPFLNKFDYEGVASLFADSDAFRYEFRPNSLNDMGKPGGFNKTEIDGFLRTLPNLVKTFGFLEPRDVVQGENKIAVHILTDGIAADDQPYRNEYMIFFTFVPGTAKIIKVVEMLDSVYTRDIGSRQGFTPEDD